MDYHNILLTLLETRFYDDMTKNIEILRKTWQQLLMKQNDHLYQQIVLELAASPDLGFQYMSTIIHILKKIGEANTNNSSGNDVSSVRKFKCIKVAIQDIMVIGIKPCLPKHYKRNAFWPFNLIACSRHNKQVGSVISPLAEPAPFEVYNRLSFAIESVVTLYENPIFRRAIEFYISPLLLGLFELCYAPLTGPSEESIKDKEELIRILSMIETWKKNQERFRLLLTSFLNMCPQREATLELAILDTYRRQMCDTRKVRFHLREIAMQPTGVASIFNAMWSLTGWYNTGSSFLGYRATDVVSEIIAPSFKEDRTTYFQAVYPQLLKLLPARGSMSDGASNCIKHIYWQNPELCRQYIVNVIKAPLQELSQSMPSESQKKFRQRTALELEKSINILHSVLSSMYLFHYDWLMPYISNIITPLFSLYNNVRRSASILRSKLERILVEILFSRPYTSPDANMWSGSRNKWRFSKLKRLTRAETRLYSHLLGFCRLDEYGYFVISRFGATGGIEIVDVNQPAPNRSELVESLIDLINERCSSFDILFALQGSLLCS